MRRLFSMLFSLVLLALVVYNTGQVMMLKREVASLKQAAVAEKMGGKGPARNSLADKAQEHLALARKYALKGDLKRADKELNTALNLMERGEREHRAVHKDGGKDPARAEGDSGYHRTAPW